MLPLINDTHLLPMNPAVDLWSKLQYFLRYELFSTTFGPVQTDFHRGGGVMHHSPPLSVPCELRVRFATFLSLWEASCAPVFKGCMVSKYFWTQFLSPPVRMHGGFLCIAFCLSVCLSGPNVTWQTPAHSQNLESLSKLLSLIGRWAHYNVKLHFLLLEVTIL